MSKDSLGNIFKEKRQKLNIRSGEAAQFLNVKESIIYEIENDQIQVLQDKNLYTYGILHSYAKFLEIDEENLDKEIEILHFQSNTENKNHLLLNVGEDDHLTPTKDDFFQFLLGAIVLFLLTISIYQCKMSSNAISSKTIISKIEK